MDIIKLIKKNILFTNFEDEEVNSIFDCLKGRIIKVSRGYDLMVQNQKVEEIGIILKGTAVQFETLPNGKKEVDSVLGSGDMFGAVDAYSGDGKSHYSVIAAEDSSVLYISVATIIRQCSNTCSYHQKLLENCMRFMAEKVASMKKDAEFLTIKSMRLKIAKLIYEKYLEQGVMDVDLGINRNEMADYLNVSRPSMSREMMRMRDEGMFDFWKSKIKIRNLEALAKIVNAK